MDCAQLGQPLKPKRGQRSHQGTEKIYPVIVQPAPATLVDGLAAAGVPGIAFGFFLAGWAVVDALNRGSQKGIERGSCQACQGYPGCLEKPVPIGRESGCEDGNQRSAGESSQVAQGGDAARSARL